MTDDAQLLSPVRILVADSRPVTRAVLTALVSSHPGWEVCAGAVDGEDAVEKTRQLNPDVAVLDVDISKLNGLETTRRIAQENPAQKIILLVASDEPSVIRAIFDCGAHGFLLKASATHDLVSSIEAVHRGRTAYSGKAADLVLREYLQPGIPESTDPSLTPRQREILALLAREFSSSFDQARNRQIRRRSRFKFVAAFAVVVALALAYIHAQDPSSIPQAFDRSLLYLGLKKAPPQVYDGNPDVKVWIDLRTALYYCPGDPHYGSHRNGRYEKQIEAQFDHFESASRKACK
nr:LuxR family DNA-binding response regulator [uncultured bacterium]